ncbi:MAG: VPLPA-CTERM sorting domain-containing protein [Gammaproteobacteria bacterium]|nr:VPLPA-CTERM sorting domain-containing protein [Gammaproteobacteria bacterium]
MNSMKKTILSLALLFLSTTTHSAAINYLELTGGTFSLGGGFYEDIFPGEFANMTIGGYDGGARIAADLTVNSIGYFMNNFGPYTFSTMRDPQNTGLNYRPVTGDITDNTLTLDLDSWTYWRSNYLINQGTNNECADRDGEVTCSSGAAVTTYDPNTGKFTAAWDSVITIDSGYIGLLGQWYIEGNVSAVPIPSAIWLFGSGLIGLVGFARRKKA